NQGILFNLLPVAFEMERGEQIDHAKVNRQKIIELFQNDKLWTYFQNTMTYKSFIDFAYKNPTKNVIDYFNSIITPIVQAIIPPKSASCKDIKNLIINNCVFMATYNFKGGIDDMPFTKESFDHLKKSILPDAFNLKNSLLGVDEQKNIKKSVLYEPKYIIQDIKNVHLHNQSIIVQTQNDIFYGMLTNDSTIFEAYYTAEHEIDNSYIAGNTLFIIDKNGLYQLELPQQLIQQEITIQQERSEELYSPTTIKEIETLITALKTDKAISVLKGLFENFDQFQIYSTDDIPNMQGIRGEGGITDCVKTGCLKPILNAWIFGIAENNNLSFGSDNEFTQIINILEEKVNDLNMWFTGLKEKDIFHNLKKSFLSYQDRTYHPNNKPEVLAEVLKRFPLLNSKTIAEEAYNEYLRSLSLCYAMETVEFEIDGQNQTYLKYARNHFKNRADKIKGLEIDPFVILHRALRKKSN
ncbi:MAG TPA: hypothetical protein VL201_03915, partial [Patescibacteria group bacterium]|nr:hypothetical protein [Patescibacteria group bacterium]